MNTKEDKHDSLLAKPGEIHIGDDELMRNGIGKEDQSLESEEVIEDRDSITGMDEHNS